MYIHIGILSWLVYTEKLMEALWNLEDKWKLSTKEAVILFACTSCLVVGLCAATALKKRAQKNRVASSSQEEGVAGGSVDGKWSEPQGNWGPVKRLLMGSVRWSGRSKWEESGGDDGRQGRLLIAGGDDVGWQSHNSDSPVWQRPILMGEKCELPRFSGLILYDDNGRPIHTDHQENDGKVVRTTLRDLL